MRRRSGVILGMVALSLAACSSGDSEVTSATTPTTESAAATDSTDATGAVTTTTMASTTTAASTSTSTSTSTTTTTVDPLTAAQTVYFSITGTINSGFGDLDARFPDISYDTYSAYCVEAAVLVETFARAVSDYTWPTGAQDEADEVARTSAAEVGLWKRCAEDPGRDVLVDIEARLRDATTAATAASNNMRLVLDLPLI